MEHIELNEESVQLSNEESSGLNLDDFQSSQYVNAPKVGETITFTVRKVCDQVPAKQRLGKDCKTMYWDGLATKDIVNNKPFKQEIVTDMGVFNVKQWELFGKLFTYKDAVLRRYAEKHNKSFIGAKVSITKLVNDGHASYSPEDLKKLVPELKTDSDVKKYKDDIILAQKEKKVYEVKLLN